MYAKGTETYNFPQWAPQEHPDFINDLNPTFEVIDRQLHILTEDNADTQQKVDTMEQVQKADTQRITVLEQSSSSQAVKLANIEHQVTDNKNNIAVNSADILEVQEDNHTIHGDLNRILSKFNTLMNYNKELLKKELTFNATYIDKTYPVTCQVYGRDAMVNIHFTPTNNLVVDSGSSANLTTNIQSTTDMHNIRFLPVRYTTYANSPNNILDAVIQGQVSDQPITISNAGQAAIGFSGDLYLFVQIEYDEIIAAENALAALQEEVVTG